MNDYINTVLVIYNHLQPKMHHLSPYKATPVIYGAKMQNTQDIENSSLLNATSIKHVQGIVRALLNYSRGVKNKLLHALSEIGSKQTTAITCTNQNI